MVLLVGYQPQLERITTNDQFKMVCMELLLFNNRHVPLLQVQIMKTSFENSFVQLALQYTLHKLKQEVDEVKDLPLIID